MKRLIRQLSHKFLHDMKFQNKFMLTNLMLVLLPTLFIFVLLNLRLSSLLTTNTLESNRSLVNQTGSAIEGTTEQLSRTMDSITSDGYLSALLYSEDPNVFLTNPDNKKNEVDFFNHVNSLIDREFITSIQIYLPDDDISYNTDTLFKSESEIRGSYWHGIFAGSPETVSLFCPDSYLSKAETNAYGTLAYIRRFDNFADSEKKTAYVAIYCNGGKVRNILSSDLTHSDNLYYLINSRNETIAESDPALFGIYYMNYEDIPTIVPDKSSFANATIIGKSTYITYEDIPDTDWRLVAVIPADNIFSEGKSIAFQTVWIYFAFTALALLLAIMLSKSIAGRLTNVVKSMNSNTGDRLTPLLDENDSDEIGQLIINYNDMVERIDNLMDEQLKNADRIRMSEANALQAQINPHFLYNMLDMINWLSQSGKMKEVSLAVQTLSKFYRMTLSKSEITTTIAEELKHVELYVKLQNMRYEDKLTLILDIPEQIMDYSIPKLVLQPIVENSIIHGIFEREEKTGTVIIMAWIEADTIVFTISDDGVGIKPHILDKILTPDSDHSGSGTNIAVYNTHQRLQLLYGPDYGLHYESTYGQGCEVTIKIPRQ